MAIAERITELSRTMVTPKISILVVRLAMGVLFLKAGLDKIIEGDWTASGFLLHATEGPFTGFMEFFANSATVDNVVMWGQVAIGLALILGAATRWTALVGAVMIGLFYIAQLPPEHGWISDKVIYILALNVLWVVRAGTYFGVDGWLVNTETKHRPLRYVLG